VAAFPNVEKQEKKIESAQLRVMPEVLQIFPELKFGVALIDGVSVKDSDETLETWKRDVVKSINIEDRKKNSKIAEEYRQMFKRFGVDPVKKKPSAPAIIDRLAYGKELITINTATDAGQLASLKHEVSVHTFDADHVALPLTLEFARPGDMFQAAGEDKPRQISKGELVYRDADGIIVAQDYNYRDSEVSKITSGTKRVLVLADGNARTDSALVKAALDDASAMIVRFAGGNIRENILLHGVPEDVHEL
jgi:DNA/RNA-binding domain of Phe-tRNA-synthetase-like protein